MSSGSQNRYSFFVVFVLFFNSQKKIQGNVQNLAKDQKLEISNEVCPDLNSADAVPFQNDPLNLQACGKILLGKVHCLPGGANPIAANILFSIVIVYFHLITIFCVKVRNFLDFNTFLRQNCVKDKNLTFDGDKGKEMELIATKDGILIKNQEYVLTRIKNENH